jgi:hypothetical protein
MRKLLVAVLFVVACSKSKDAASPAAGSGSGSAPTMAVGSGSGSAPAMAAGSAGSGSGSAMGSAVAAGSGSGSGEAGEAHTGGFDFDKLTHDEKMKFMKEKVVPPMKKAFQDFDAKKYAEFGCKTCHGKDPKKTKFKMPNPELPALDFKALEAGKQKPKVAEWMAKVVKPEMAKILEQPEMTKDNPKGFGCLECHTQKK